MELENATLVTLLITLLAIKPVGSARDRGTGPLPAPPTLQHVGDQLALSNGSEEIGQVPHEPSTGEKIPSVPVKAIDPIASTHEGIAFREAMQDGYMKNARDVFSGGSGELKKYCVKHLVGLGSSRLVQLINRANDDNKVWMLQIILVHADQSLIESVFGAFKPSNNLLMVIAHSADVACVPQSFKYLLGKIDNRYQKLVVERGVRALVDKNKTKCLDPLVSALNEETFLSKDLGNIAIRKAFRMTPWYRGVKTLFARRFFDHNAITAEDYSDVLYRSYERGGKTKDLFKWLLARADRQDLEAVKKAEDFSAQEFEFQKAVNQALQAVGSKTKEEITRPERIAFMEETLTYTIPKVLLDIIGGYF